MFVATAVAYACYRTNLDGLCLWPLGWPDLAFALLETVFLLTSRDTLRKYYNRSRQLLHANPTLRRRSFFFLPRRRNRGDEDESPSPLP